MPMALRIRGKGRKRGGEKKKRKKRKEWEDRTGKNGGHNLLLPPIIRLDCRGVCRDCSGPLYLGLTTDL